MNKFFLTFITSIALAVSSAQALMVPSLINIYLQKHGLEEGRHVWKEAYLVGVGHLGGGKKILIYETKTLQPPMVSRTDQLINELSPWVDLKVGQVNPKDHLDNFTACYDDYVFDSSTFDKKYAYPLPKKGLGSFVKFSAPSDFYVSMGWGDPNNCKKKKEVKHEALRDKSINNTPFDYGEYFKVIEAGYDNKDVGRFYVLVWDQDELKSQKKPGGRGVVAHMEKRYNDWVPFVRYSHVDGKVCKFDHVASLGFSHHAPFLRKDDKMGVIATLSHPKDSRYKNQATVESYYQCKVASKTTITPHVQFHHHPYKKDRKAEAAVGIRFSTSF